MQVRPMAQADAPAVAALSAQLGYPATPAAIAQRFDAIVAAPNHSLLVAEAGDGRVVGWVHVHRPNLLPTDPAAEIWGLVVDADHRGSGVGRQLMAAAEGWALERGYCEMRLRSNAVRETAHRFYLRLGYEEVKRSLTFRKALPSAVAVTDVGPPSRRF